MNSDGAVHHDDDDDDDADVKTENSMYVIVYSMTLTVMIDISRRSYFLTSYCFSTITMDHIIMSMATTGCPSNFPQ